MGFSSSKIIENDEVISEDVLEEYIQLTYLSRSEILRLLSIFSNLDKENFNIERRYSKGLILQLFPQLNMSSTSSLATAAIVAQLLVSEIPSNLKKYNPFRDRLFKVFSSLKDDCFSFEDTLDLCSVMSSTCPEKIKAAWAFYVYDLNDDGLITKEDINASIRKLTQTNKRLRNEEVNHISNVLLKAIDLQGNDAINQLEFQHAVGKMPDFSSSFMFRI